MKNTTISELINTMSSVEGRVYQMMETALLVMEEFKNLWEHTNDLNEDFLYGRK